MKRLNGSTPAMKRKRRAAAASSAGQKRRTRPRSTPKTTDRPAPRPLTARKSKPGLPTREQVLAYHRTPPDNTTRREIARAFDVRGNDKIALKALLKDIARAEAPEEDRAAPRRLPSSLVVEVFDVDTDEGEALAHPVDPELGRPIIHIRGGRGTVPLADGDRALVRIAGRRGRRFVTQGLRRLELGPEKLLAAFPKGPQSGRPEPAGRKVKNAVMISPPHSV